MTFASLKEWESKNHHHVVNDFDSNTSSVATINIYVNFLPFYVAIKQPSLFITPRETTTLTLFHLAPMNLPLEHAIFASIRDIKWICVFECQLLNYHYLSTVNFVVPFVLVSFSVGCRFSLNTNFAQLPIVFVTLCRLRISFHIFGKLWEKNNKFEAIFDFFEVLF